MGRHMRDIDKIRMNRDEAWLSGFLTGFGVTFAVLISVIYLRTLNPSTGDALQTVLNLLVAGSVLLFGAGHEIYRRSRNK